MLHIFFGDKKDAVYGPVWFKYNYEQRWFEDPLVQSMMKDIDKSEYLGGELIRSEVLGPIPPERLSGGLKTLISILKRPDLVFDATSCGPNCGKWLLEIGTIRDVTVELKYIMPLDGLEPFSVYIENEQRTVTDVREYTYSAMESLGS